MAFDPGVDSRVYTEHCTADDSGMEQLDSLLDLMMKRRNWSKIVLSVVLFTLLMTPGHMLGNQNLRELKNLEELRVHFNQDHGILRIVLLLSPT